MIPNFRFLKTTQLDIYSMIPNFKLLKTKGGLISCMSLYYIK